MAMEPGPFATKRRVGCVMWLSIAALFVSSVSILLDITQEMAWNTRVEQAQASSAAIATPVVAEVVAQDQAIGAETPVSVAPASTGVTFENVCDVDESNMTDPQIKAHAEQFVGQHIEGWPMWVYDVTDSGTGQYNLELAGAERGLFWTRDVVIENIDPALATSLNVEQQVTLSGRIDRVDTTFEVVCNPLYMTDATIMLSDGSQVTAAAPASAVIIAPVGTALPNTEASTLTPIPVPTDTPLPPQVPVVVAPKDARDSLFVHGNNSPQLPPGEIGKVSVIAFGKMQGTILPIILRNNTATYVTRIEVSGIARGGDGGMLATGGDQGIDPNLVQPGEVAFGYVYFGDVTLPEGTTFEFQTEFEPAGSSFEEFENTRDLEVTEVSLVENRIVGLMRNQYAEVVTGPIGVAAMCFDAAGQLLGHHNSYTDQDTVAAGATVAYQIDLYDDPCPVFLVMGSGFSE